MGNWENRRSFPPTVRRRRRTTKNTSILRTVDFQMPIELMQSGYIGSISYKGQNANIDVGSAYSKSFPPTEKSWCVSLPLQARAPRRLTGPTAAACASLPSSPWISSPRRRWAAHSRPMQRVACPIAGRIRALNLIAAAADSSFLLLALLQPENPVTPGFSGYVYMCTVSYLRLAQMNQQ